MKTPIEEITKALAEATPGPWRVYQRTWITNDHPDWKGMHVADVRGWGHLTGAGAKNLPPERAREIQEATGHLIANAPTWLAELVEEVERLRSENEALLLNCPYPYCHECECETRTCDEDGCCNSCGSDPEWPTSETIRERETLRAENAELRAKLAKVGAVLDKLEVGPVKK